MIRRLTSAPKPAALVRLMTSSALAIPSSPVRSPYRIASKRARLDEHSLGAIR